MSDIIDIIEMTLNRKQESEFYEFRNEFSY